MNLLSPFVAAADTLASLVTGMGTRSDKATGSRFVLARMDDVEAIDAYRGDWISRAIVDIPANDMTREWRAWQADDAQIQAIEDEERRLDVLGVVAKATKLARLMGGSGIVIGDGSADPSKPLDPAAIKKGGIQYLLALGKNKLVAGEVDWEPGPNYGKPKDYTINAASGTAVTLHPSRVIRFIGAWVPEEDCPDAQGWGDSVLLAVRDALVAAGTSTQAIAALLLEAKVDVVKIPGLMAKVANPKDKDNLLARFSLAGIAKSIHGVMITDKEEEWEQKTINFAQMPELIDRFLQIVSGAADIPATRLLGQSPKGMNSTGESDLRNFYDRLASDQKVVLTPTLRQLDECLVWSALGTRPKEVHYLWNPLWQLSAKEKAEVAKSKAETTKIHKDLGFLPESALAKAMANQLVEDGVYPGLEAALLDAEADGELAPYEEPPPAMPGIDPATGLPTAVPPARALPTASPRRQIPAQKAANDALVAPLYVSRPVVNAAAIIEWAREQGFKTTLPADQLHVTIANSTRSVDWQAIPPLTDPMTCTVDNGREDDYPSYRWVCRLGDDGAVVLAFESHQLRDRWQALIDAGASWVGDHFWPHITLSYDAGAYLEPWAVEAWLGVIELGPERYDAPTDDAEEKRPREVSTEGGTS